MCKQGPVCSSVLWPCLWQHTDGLAFISSLPISLHVCLSQELAAAEKEAMADKVAEYKAAHPKEKKAKEAGKAPRPKNAFQVWLHDTVSTV